jgi:electron transfer flavoprotein beta subunit
MIGVAIKWTPGRPEVDSGGSISTDDRFGGVSLADQAALEVALSFGEAVKVVSVGPDNAINALRDSIAVGADATHFVQCAEQPASHDVAALLAQPFADCRLVVCGDYSSDRGSGSVPAFLAANLSAAQALGLVSVANDRDSITCVRRLDGGRREVVLVTPTLSTPAVISVEGSVAKLRRAPLARTLAARSAEIPTTQASIHVEAHGEVSRYRPPTRVVKAPHGVHALERIRLLTDSTAAKSRGELVNLSPSEAADRILAAMREWGYLKS